MPAYTRTTKLGLCALLLLVFLAHRNFERALETLPEATRAWMEEALRPQLVVLAIFVCAVGLDVLRKFMFSESRVALALAPCIGLAGSIAHLFIRRRAQIIYTVGSPSGESNLLQNSRKLIRGYLGAFLASSALWIAVLASRTVG
jgi:hypothetical protein